MQLYCFSGVYKFMPQGIEYGARGYDGRLRWKRELVRPTGAHVANHGGKQD